MTLSLAEVRRVVDELTRALDRGIVQAAKQPHPHTLLLDVRVPGQSHTLLVCTAAGTERVHLTTRRMVSPAQPHAFLMKVRKEVVGSRIERVRLVGDDRVVAFDLVRSERHPQGEGQLVLVVELVPRSGNAWLLDDADRALLALDPTTARRGRPGEHYEPPPPPPQQREGRDRTLGAASPSQAIDALYEAQEHDSGQDDETAVLCKALRAAIARERRKEQKIATELLRAEATDELVRKGELLKSELHRIERGARSVRVTDWYDPELGEVDIPLDPARSAREQVDRLFHEARRLANAREMVRGRLQATAKRAAELDRALYDLETAPDERERAEAAERARALGINAQAKRPDQPKERATVRLPYREFAAADGTVILVGRSAKDNDSLTFRIARADDWWLHARGRTGTHVIVRTPRGGEPRPEALADGAQLAALYSEGGATDSGVEVAATPRKYVRKPKGAPPGSVTFSKAKTLYVTPDPARLERLKTTRRDTAG